MVHPSDAVFLTVIVLKGGLPLEIAVLACVEKRLTNSRMVDNMLKGVVDMPSVWKYFHRLAQLYALL